MIRGFVGDIIIILLLYFLAKAFYDFSPLKLTICILLIAYTTEFLQYLKLTTYLGLENNKAAQIILGAVFDPYDLVAYTFGAVLVYILDKQISSALKRI
jgi:hypothetical protein